MCDEHDAEILARRKDFAFAIVQIDFAFEIAVVPGEMIFIFGVMSNDTPLSISVLAILSSAAVGVDDSKVV
jgi:hypothetical protein